VGIVDRSGQSASYRTDGRREIWEEQTPSACRNILNMALPERLSGSCEKNLRL